MQKEKTEHFAIPRSEHRNAALPVSVAIFVTAIGLMVWLKVLEFPDRYVSLTYALPLLICLWHRDRRLLWAMAAAFGFISAWKSFILQPQAVQVEWWDLVQWLMQTVNIAVVATSVHVILNLTDRLRRQNAELAAANDELVARGEEIERQNEELQAQSEELAQQNEELQQQGEELGRANEELIQQSEELERQTQELQGLNQELHRRERMLHVLLGSLGHQQDQFRLLEHACQAVFEIIGEPGCVCAVVERKGDDLLVVAQAGDVLLSSKPRAFAASFAAVVVQHDRSAFVDDLLARPDLTVPQPDGYSFRSVLATPLRIEGKNAGVLKIYSPAPRRWSKQHFQLIEWVAAQCSTALRVLRLQQELSRANLSLEEQVQKRTGALRDMINELEHFSYTITHDMRAPLRAIRGFAGTLEPVLAHDPESKAYLDRISNAAGRMDRLITDALHYSKAGKQELTLRPVLARQLLEGIIESYPDLQAPKAHISIAGDIPPVLANEAGLTQCFSNLLNNAVKFVEQGRTPEVCIRAECMDDRVRLCFQDNGIGIPETFRPRLFKMFQRASKAHEGTGVGLALVRKVAEQMGGAVGVDSVPGEGSQFWLELTAAAASDMGAPAMPKHQTAVLDGKADI